MDSDFSNAKIGDWAWTVHAGWCKIGWINVSSNYSFLIGKESYNSDGKTSRTDIYPSAFLVPPTDFNAGSPPCEFEEGDKVIVWNDEVDKYRAYFSHFSRNDSKYHCFYPGDKWSSYGDTRAWKYCERWKGEEK
jgi:hypothetical protein